MDIKQIIKELEKIAIKTIDDKNYLWVFMKNTWKMICPECNWEWGHEWYWPCGFCQTTWLIDIKKYEKIIEKELNI